MRRPCQGTPCKAALNMTPGSRTAPMWMAVVARWYARCTPAWMGNKKQTRISLANTSAASATWKLYPAKAVGATDLQGKGSGFRAFWQGDAKLKAHIARPPPHGRCTLQMRSARPTCG